MNLQSIGDLNFLVRTIVAAVLVALLFSTATMMMQSLRERTAELAVLKALGFTNRAVLLLILVEATMVCTTAAVCGLTLATAVFPAASKFVPGLSMPPSVVGLGLGLALVVSLVKVNTAFSTHGYGVGRFKPGAISPILISGLSTTSVTIPTIDSRGRVQWGALYDEQGCAPDLCGFHTRTSAAMGWSADLYRPE